MIKLKNITIKGKTATADLEVEDSKERGKIEVDLSLEEVIGYSLPTGYNWCKKHIEHAKKYLVELSNTSENPPNEKLLMWC